jgi:putative transposase
VPYWEHYFHVVWSTKGRLPLLVDERAIIADKSIRATCREKGAVVHAVAIMPDHVHVAVSIPPSLSVSDLMHAIKGSSSHLLNRDPSITSTEPFAWQPEYGSLTFGKRSLADVVAYVLNQRRHHADGDLLHAFERIDRDRAAKPDPSP